MNFSSLKVKTDKLLTLAERRFYNYLLLTVAPDYSDKRIYDISIKKLLGVFSTAEPTEAQILNTLDALMKVVIEVTETGTHVFTGLLSYVRYDDLDRKIKFSFSLAMINILRKALTLEKLLIQAHFTHKYTGLLYDLFATHFYKGDAEYRLSMRDLRGYLNIKKNKLENFADFSRFALIPSVTEINLYASFSVSFSTSIKGRRVDELIFKLCAQREVSGDLSSIIPPRRPCVTFDTQRKNKAYEFILNAITKKRKKYFDIACKLAKRQGCTLNPDVLDTPDLWVHWVFDQIAKAEALV